MGIEKDIVLRPKEAAIELDEHIDGEPWSYGKRTNVCFNVKEDLLNKIREIVKQDENNLSQGYYLDMSTTTFGAERIILWKRPKLRFLGSDNNVAYFGDSILVRYDFSDPEAKKLYDITIGKGRAIYEE